MARERGDHFIRFYGPLLDALRELGGSATPGEAKAVVIDKAKLSDTELTKLLPSGGSAVENEIAWARDYLRRAGLIDGSERGIWRLTETGRNTRLSVDQARELRKGIYEEMRRQKGGTESDPPDDSIEATPDSDGDLLAAIYAVSPPGFERLCQRILREAGFSEVRVTGKSSDGGIDGDGILQVNELMSFRVLFQCKRYQGAVGAKEIRDFRGAMIGRTDKGIYLTTGSFTREAEKEATREGAPPLELVNGDELVRLMQRLGLGVSPRTVYDVDARFFQEFQ